VAIMSVMEGQQRLIAIAEAIKLGTKLSDEDAKFLSEALIKITEGEEPKAALNIKARRGERTSKAYREKLKEGSIMKSLALGWLATAIAPESEGGLGLTNEDAIGRIGEFSPIFKDTAAFGFTEETLLTYWAKYPELRDIVFKLPD
jgi:hypothetical protein